MREWAGGERDVGGPKRAMARRSAPVNDGKGGVGRGYYALYGIVDVVVNAGGHEEEREERRRTLSVSVAMSTVIAAFGVEKESKSVSQRKTGQ